MTLSEFLLARFAEDEAAWREGAGLVTEERFAQLSRHMLVEVATKREVLRHHSPVPSKKHPGYDCLWCEMPYPCFDARALAHPYAGHPDFRDHWRLLP